jgi:hypothetical protein
VRLDACCHGAVSHKKSELDIPVQSGFSKVCGRHQDTLVVHDHRLGVQHCSWPVYVERARVVEHAGLGSTRPLNLPKAVGKLPHQLICRRGVALAALNVDQQRGSE